MELREEQRTAVDNHVRLLLAWNHSINLTAIRDPVDVALAHVVDSLTAVALLRERGIDRFVDLGSGGGFPGVPLAIALPAKRALLVDSIGKKVRFLETSARALGLEKRVVTFIGRAEELAREPAQREGWPAVTARAVAGLPDLIELAFPLLRVDGALVAWKRGDIEAEVAAGRRAADALGGGTLETHAVRVGALGDHRIVVAVKRGRSRLQFPRDPAVRRRTPL